MAHSITFIALLIVAVVFLIVAWLFDRFAIFTWCEQRLPRHFSRENARFIEGQSVSHPIGFFLHFFVYFVGGLAIIEDLKPSGLGPIFRYGVAGILSAYGLYVIRRQARRRAD